jgi:hypothetical protein
MWKKLRAKTGPSVCTRAKTCPKNDVYGVRAKTAGGQPLRAETSPENAQL